MEVDFDDRWVDIIEEGYDLVVRIGTLEDSSLIARKLADCPIRLYASPEFVRQKGKPESIEQVADFPSVLYTKQNQSSVWLYKDSNSSKGSIVMQRAFAANTAEMQLQACLEGIGIALIPIFAAAPYLLDGSLVPVLPNYEMSPKREIYTLFPQRRYLSTKVRLLVDYLLEQRRDFMWIDQS